MLNLPLLTIVDVQILSITTFDPSKPHLWPYLDLSSRAANFHGPLPDGTPSSRQLQSVSVDILAESIIDQGTDY
jgi:hypothetical protein